MDLRNCPRCGRIFADNGTHRICSDCRHQEEDDYEKVKAFLWDNPRSTIGKVHEETGVSEDTIIKFIRENRLITEGLEIKASLKCQRCGTTISHGRFCQKCQDELVDGFSDTGKEKKSKKKKKSGSDMYIKDRIKERKENK